MIENLAGCRILIFGGAGFIGQHLCRALLLTGATVRCFDLIKPKSNSIVNDLGNEAEWIIGDFSDAEQLKEAITGVDFIFHLISTTIPDTSNKDLQHDLASNVLSTLKLLEAVRGSHVKKVVFVSSGGTVYGVPNTVPIPETHALNPICGYGIHKLAIEKYLYLYNYNYGMDYCILRLSNPYGIAQISDRPQGVIGKFIYKAIKQEALEIWGDGSVVRDYVYVDDMIEAFISAISYSGKENIFNVASGTGHSLMDIIEMIEHATGRTLSVQFLPSRHVDVPLNILDSSRIRNELHWVPKVDMRSGIQRMLEYGSSIKHQL